MKKILRKCLLTTAIVSFLLLSTVNATSWVKLKPEEVIERSTVIVQGEYDFSKKRKGSNFIWVGYDFRVDRVYKGNVSGTIIAGIDGFDIGWVDQIQQSNGNFVLFLEQTEVVDYLTPVGGPNGMIHIQNNEVQHSDEDVKEIFNDFLTNTKHRLPEPSLQTDNTLESNRFVIVVFCVLIISCVLYMVYRKINLNKTRK